MDIRTLSKIDLKLLVVFIVIMEECNLSRASERLFLTQPALSHSLKRLRDIFKDPLFTRSGYGLVPTPVAQELYGNIQPLLEKLSATIDSDSLDPVKMSGVFRISSAGPSSILLRKLLEMISEQGSSLKLEYVIIDSSCYEQLSNGTLDLLIHTPLARKDNFIYEQLVVVKQYCIVPKGHPLFGKKTLTLKEYLQYPHIRHKMPSLPPLNHAVVDEKLRKMGKKRRIFYETSFSDDAYEQLEGTENLFTLADLYNFKFIDKEKFFVAELPKEISNIELPVMLIYHKRSTNSPTHKWFREKIKQLCDMGAS